MSPIFVQLLLHHHLLLLLFYLNNQGPKVIEYPRTWLMLSLTNFGVGKGKSFRGQYTQHVSKDVYSELIRSPTLFKSFVHLEVEEFDELVSELPDFHSEIKCLDFKNKVKINQK
jgi:hypothetical protein